jgi:predicted O-linked N-acetylglucosamine transferase (SPINDLY family)
MREPTGLFDMMQEYADMDIALDPFPYNGGTTTLQALWMGVPVITLEGENFVGRMGVSFLQALGRPEWIAKTPEEYVSKVVELAQQPELLNQLHENLRHDVQSTRLGDIQTYTENFEKLLLRIAQFDE